MSCFCAYAMILLHKTNYEHVNNKNLIAKFFITHCVCHPRRVRTKKPTSIVQTISKQDFSDRMRNYKVNQPYEHNFSFYISFTIGASQKFAQTLSKQHKLGNNRYFIDSFALFLSDIIPFSTYPVKNNFVKKIIGTVVKFIRGKFRN